MTIRDHYIVVPVTPAEVQFERESVTQQLAKLPVVGLLVQAWFAPRSEEEFDAMGAELTERLRRVERGYGRLRAVPHRASTPTRWRRCSRHSGTARYATRARWVSESERHRSSEG